MDNIQGNHSDIQDTTFEIEEPLNVEELMASLPLDKDDLKENVIVMSPRRSPPSHPINSN